MHVMLVAGARPNFMKVAPILRALAEAGVDSSLVHTGQHYGATMSDSFFRDLGIRTPDFNLGVGSGTHAEQTARVMLAFEPIVFERRPDWVVVVGDVNSTLACSIVVAKLRPSLGCRLAHVEAGLRSGDWSMPEEINRLVTDRVSDLLLIPSSDARANLLREGIPDDRIEFGGNVMIDTLLQQLPAARKLDSPGRFGVTLDGYAVATLHRPSNVDAAGPLGTILAGLALVAKQIPIVLPLHPRTRKNAEEFGLAGALRSLTITEPLGYTEMLSLTAGAAVVLTDSGGLQEETTALGIPCVTLREQTERPVTITEGTNQLASWPLSPEGLLRNFEEALARRQPGRIPCTIEGWDGRASQRIVEVLRRVSSIQ